MSTIIHASSSYRVCVGIAARGRTSVWAGGGAGGGAGGEGVHAAAGGGTVQEGALQQVHRGLVPALLQPGNMDTYFKHLPRHLP